MKDKVTNNRIDFDAHWYRRVFHTFGAALLVYYLLPNYRWINTIKILLPIAILAVVALLEFLRIKGKISSDHFFGLRMYEKKRIGSYLFFGTGIVLLLLFFPQQIAVPCILCACIADPVMGEIRYIFEEKTVYLIGFLLCMFLFMISWYKADIFIMVIISLIGSIGAVIGETQKFWWLDDDFLIQILPAAIISILWIGSKIFIGVELLPEQIIYPVEVIW